MATNTEQGEVLSPALLQQWQQIGAKIVRLAEEFPEQHYDFRPIAEVRTFADVLRHVAFWNRYVADLASGKDADSSTNVFLSVLFFSFSLVLRVFQQSFHEATAALRKDQNDLSRETAETVLTFIGHSSEHYGQLTVYCRLNGIVPPESRSES